MPNGTDQYAIGTSNSPPDGFINMEFETALYIDILRPRSDQTAFSKTGIPQGTIDEYIAWLDAITENNTKYPKKYSDLQGQYFYFMDLFKQHSSYTNGNYKTDLYPNTLLNLFNTTNCK